MEILNIGIVASVDSGKTTLTEKIVELSTEGYKAGRVEEGTTTTDYHSFEKRRGITVFSAGTDFIYRGEKYNIIDTPGHIDFFEETRRSFLAMDTVIFIISAIEGVTDRVKEIWKMVSEENLPVVVFINKCDIPHSMEERAVTDLKKLSEKCVEFCGADEIVERLCEVDENIMEKYIEDELCPNEIDRGIKKQILYGNIIPVIKGAASTGQGVEKVLDCLSTYYPKYIKDDKGSRWGIVYKLSYSSEEGMLSHIKVLSGSLKVREEIETERGVQKITEIRRYRGKEYITVEEVGSGDVAVVKGLAGVEVGEYIGILAPKAYKPKGGNLTTSFVSQRYMELAKAMEILHREQGGLNPRSDSEQGQVEITTSGRVHLEIIKELLMERFGIESEYLQPLPIYKEGILETTRGFCHYEPKKHYARVEVDISPHCENTFESRVRLDDLSYRYQSIIEKTIPEALSCGVLLGRELTGVKVSLVGGKAHEEHTHGGDFRIATIRSVRQALEKNKNILLEPSLFYEVTTPVSEGGDMEKVFKSIGLFYEYRLEEEDEVYRVKVPISQKDILDKKIGVTGGSQRIAVLQGEYVRCEDSEEVVKKYSKRFITDEKLFNSVSLFREKKKMKKVRGY